MDNIYTAVQAAKEAGCRSFYLYEKKGILSAIQLLKDSFPGYTFLYSVKANPFGPVLDTIHKEGGFGADAASLNEVLLAKERGVAREDLLYSAPGKTEQDMRAAFDDSILIADSIHELELIDQIAKEKGVVAEIGIRINPDFTMDSDHGSSGKFGIDEELLLNHPEILKSLCNIQPVGIHIHVRSQILDASVLGRYYANVCSLAERMSGLFGVPLSFINFGGGLGVVYSDKTETPLNLAVLGKEAATLLKSMQEKFPKIRMILETGRFTVCKSGCYAAEIIDKKTSRGTTYLILQNTLNGFMRPSLAQMALGYRADAQPNEPLFTSGDAFTFSIAKDSGGTETVTCNGTEAVTLVGNLCTGADIMAKNVSLPKAEIGDFVVVSNAGSYAATLTPTLFASQTAPSEFLVAEDGTLISK